MSNTKENKELQPQSIPSFYNKFKGSISEFKKFLKHLESKKDPLLDSINRGQVFIYNDIYDDEGQPTGEIQGLAIYANGMYYKAASDANFDDTIKKFSEGEEFVYGTHAGIITLGDTHDEAKVGDKSGEIQVTNTVGNVKEGVTIGEDTNIYELLKNMLQKTSYPVIHRTPSVNITTKIDITEVGDKRTSSLTYSYKDGAFMGKSDKDNKNIWHEEEVWNAGCKDESHIFSCTSYKDDIDSDNLTHIFEKEETVTVGLTVNHSASVTPLDSLGKPCEDLIIPAGQVSDTMTYTSKYKSYWGFAPYNQQGFQDPTNGTPIDGLDDLLPGGSWYADGFVGKKEGEFVGVMESGTDDNRTFVIIVPEGKGVVFCKDIAGNDITKNWHETKQKVIRKFNHDGKELSIQYSVWCSYLTKSSSAPTKYISVTVGDKK